MTRDLVLGDQRATDVRDLSALANPHLDPIFWDADCLAMPGTWWGHVPLGHWLVCALRPPVIIELGTVPSISYDTFCRAVVRGRLDTRCYAVASDRENATAGQFRAHHDKWYGSFSTLLDVDLDTTTDFISNGTVGLLHVDLTVGTEVAHRAIKTWTPKLSDGAVLLVHGTRARTNEPDLRRQWRELTRHFPHFEFPHEDGLGLLAIGANVPAPVAGLFSLSDLDEADRIRSRFAALGNRWERAGREARQAHEFTRRLATLYEETDRLRRCVVTWRARSREEERARVQIAHRLTAARRDVYAANLRADQTAAVAAAASDEARAASDEARAASDEARAARDAESRAVLDRDAVLFSRSWLLTRPLRHWAMRYPGLSRLAWRIARLLWWTFSLQLANRYREWQRRPRGTVFPQHRGDRLELATPSLPPPVLPAPADTTSACGEDAQTVHRS